MSQRQREAAPQASQAYVSFGRHQKILIPLKPLARRDLGCSARLRRTLG
jgi:hypothetical protein